MTARTPDEAEGCAAAVDCFVYESAETAQLIYSETTCPVTVAPLCNTDQLAQVDECAEVAVKDCNDFIPLYGLGCKACGTSDYALCAPLLDDRCSARVNVGVGETYVFDFAANACPTGTLAVSASSASAPSQVGVAAVALGALILARI